MEFRELSREDSAAIVPLANKLHPGMDPDLIRGYLAEMFDLPNYHCLGLWQESAIKPEDKGFQKKICVVE